MLSLSRMLGREANGFEWLSAFGWRSTALRSRNSVSEYCKGCMNGASANSPLPRRTYLTCSARTAYSLESENQRGLSWFCAARGAGNLAVLDAVW